MPTVQTIIKAIEGLRDQSPTVVVGVSGFGGAGKSTLARALTAAIDRSARIRGDDFLQPERSHRRSSEWAGVERLRLLQEVIDPFHDQLAGQFRRYNWGMRQLMAPQALPNAEVLIVDAIGLFHPELAGAFDLTVWVDLELAEATERGKARDRALGRDHDQLWDEVWVPNERDFVARFDPRAIADLLFDTRSV